MSNFDQKAHTWDTPERVERAQQWAEALLGLLPPAQDMHVVEFGAGTGLLSFALAPRVGEVLALDGSTGMLEKLREKQQRSGLTNVRCELVDFEAWQAQTPCDCFVSCLTLHHIPKTEHYAQKAFKATLSGGHAVVVDLDLEYGEFHTQHDGVFHHGFDRDHLGALFEAAGFRKPVFLTVPGIRKESRSGPERDFSVFMMIAEKP